MESFLKGRRLSVGRPMMRWVDNICEWSGCNITELKMAALKRRVVSKAAVVVTVVYNLMRQPRAYAYCMLNDDMAIPRQLSC